MHYIVWSVSDDKLIINERAITFESFRVMVKTMLDAVCIF